MSFQTIEKGSWTPLRRPKVVNRVAYATASKDGSAMVFTLSGDLVTNLGDPRRVKVMLGTGEHRGKILIKGAKDGEPNSYSLCSQREASVKKFTISKHRLGLSKALTRYKTTTTSHKMTEEGLMVWLPE